MIVWQGRFRTHLPEIPILRVQVGSELGLVVEEQGVVGSEHDASGDTVGVVHVVKRVGRHGVQRNRHIGVAVLGTHLLQMQGVIRVQRRVDAVRGAREFSCIDEP